MILKKLNAENFRITIYEAEHARPQMISIETDSEKASIADFANILYKHVIFPPSVFKLLTSSKLHLSVKTPNNEFCFTDEKCFYALKNPEMILHRIANNILI